MILQKNIVVVGPRRSSRPMVINDRCPFGMRTNYLLVAGEKRPTKTNDKQCFLQYHLGYKAFHDGKCGSLNIFYFWPPLISLTVSMRLRPPFVLSQLSKPRVFPPSSARGEMVRCATVVPLAEATRPRRPAPLPRAVRAVQVGANGQH